MNSFKQYVSKILLFSILFFTVTIFLTSKINAQGVNDFVINDFDAQYEITNDDPQGRLEVTETIKLNFSGQNRGILRAIPEVYNSNKLDLKIESVERDNKKEPYITYIENDNVVLRIGDSDVYLTGEHSYEIRYTLNNVISFYEDYDEFYWDVNGAGWAQAFEDVSATVRTSAQLSGKFNPICYTGEFGSTEQNCEAKKEGYRVTYNTLGPLGAGENLTIVQGFEKGYFTPETWAERNWGLIVASPLFLLQLLIVYSAYKQWSKYGKDYDSKIIAPYFGRPKGLSVMQAGYVLENKLLPKHLSAAIIDLSIRRYLTISESGSGKKAKHTLIIENLPDSYLEPDEKELMKSLFAKLKVGEKTTIESKKNKLYKTLNSISKNINEKMITKGYYETSPRDKHKKITNQLLGMGIAGILGLAFYEFTNFVSFYSTIAMVVLTLFFLSLMTKRSLKGKMIHDHMKGLKLYLKKAEKERLKMQDAVAAPLSADREQPIRDRDFFEKLLPFAIAMGVENTWAKSFSDLYSEPPEWYQGSWSTFSTAALISSVNSTVSSTGATFQAPSSSSGSGFSGGGSSGGGGGGGGGGGW